MHGRGTAWQRGVHGMGVSVAGEWHVWQGVCMAGGMHGGGVQGRGMCMAGGHVVGRVCMAEDMGGREACVAGGMHGRGACMAGGTCMAGGCAWHGDMCGREWQGGVHGIGACVAGVAWQGGMCGRGGHAWDAHPLPSRYYKIWSMGGWYASYWNAFLLK